MQQEIKTELNLENRTVEQQILSIFQEIKDGYLVESNDIFEDLNPLISKLNQSDKGKVVQALKTNFNDYEFFRKSKYCPQEKSDIQEEDMDYTIIYNSDREKDDYESILDRIKLAQYRKQNQIPDEFIVNLSLLRNLKIKALLVFDLLDYHLNKKDLTQIQILKILFQLFYCNSTFANEELKKIEQLIGSLLQKQLNEISYYFEILKQDDPKGYKNFVQLLQQQQLKIINETNKENLQKYKILFMVLSKEIINIRFQIQEVLSQLIQLPFEQCSYTEILTYINNIENVNDKLNDLYLLIVFYYWKKYCIQYDLQIDLKNQEDSLPNLIGNERKFKFIERYLNKQKSNSQDKIYLFVIHRICYFFEDIEIVLGKDIFQQFIKTMANNLNILKQKQKQLMIILNDKPKFMEYWKIIHSLKFYKQEISQNISINQIITNLLWLNSQNDNLFNTLKNIMSNKNKSFLDNVEFIEEEIKQINVNSNQFNLSVFKTNFLRIIYAKFPKEEKNYLLLKNLIEKYGSLMRASIILEASNLLNNKLTQKTIQFFAKVSDKFIVIHKIFPPETLSKLANDVLNYMLSNNQINIQECILILKSIFAVKQVILSEDLQFIRILIKKFCTNVLTYLIIINMNKNISLTSVKWTMCAIFNLLKKIDKIDLSVVEKCIGKLFQAKIYNFPFLFKCLRDKINFSDIYKIVQLQYYFSYKQQKELGYLSQNLFEINEQLYEEWFKLKKPQQLMLQIEYLTVKKSQQYYPKQMDIPLEDFNISLSEYCEFEQKQILSDWIQDMSNSHKFKSIIPLFFNLIKREESPKDILIYTNSILQNFKKIADGIGCFNQKSLFQIFFNNANDELKVILMKFFSKKYPIPFLYQNPILDNLKLKSEICLLNSNLFYLIESGYTIINFSLSQNQKKIGKTKLINQIFYAREKKFETNDTCQINSNTIDIMFDFEFNNSRNFIVADVHGKIIMEILIKILSFFQFWIVQMDSEKELQENLDQIKTILQKIGQQQKDQLEICFIVRNTEQIDLVNEQTHNYEIERKKIQIFYIHNLSSNQIDKQLKTSQLQNVSKFLFNQILDHQKKLEQGNSKSKNKKEQFLILLKQFNPQYQNNIEQINNHQNLINKIQQKLNQTVKEEDGFYSQNAFPIRHIQQNIKQLRNQNYKLCLKPTENKTEIDMNKQKIQANEKQIQKQTETELLKFFCEIFKQKHYYIAYLWIVDSIRQFNEINLLDLQKQDQQLTKQFNDLKQEKRKIKQKYLNNLTELCGDPRNTKIKDEMSKLKHQMDKNVQNIQKKNIGIELFWRELISLRKSNCYTLEFDPVDTISQLIRKGESLEFLDGDTLSINTEFLFDLEKKITQNNQQKILVISILGPQSSGKSTILNKIFGCHFWTSVGRCTKGIHLQILQVQNKDLFQNLFDQILILDTEGLQNPNQIDSEFDKKIALFVLSISDIIMINVKGEIHLQFKSLVKMCIFTLGHLKNGLSMFKQLSWFFNQNDKYRNLQPFKDQIKDLSQELNSQYNENYFDQQEEYIDYADILDIKENIYGLGFASDQIDWGQNTWNQSVNNHTFSREAHSQGIKMIKQFISKLQDQKDTLNNFHHFLQNVQRNWESIEKLPDLLEFSELIQHQNNLIMKKYLDNLWKMQNISSEGERLIENTKQKLLQNPIVFNFYQNVQKSTDDEIESTYTQISKQILEKMFTFKDENKIQKKIMQKYTQKLEHLINTEKVDCRLKVQQLIEDYEREYQQKKGYVYIDNFIQDVLYDITLKAKFQGNDKLIEQEFKIKWDQYISQTERESDQQYNLMVETQYKAMKSVSTQYILNTKNEQEYFKNFMDKIIKQNPSDLQNKDEEKIFQLFKQEFQENEQFICINKNNKQNLAYSHIFHQKIEEKLLFKDQLLDITQFYTKEINYSVVAKLDIQEYLQNGFENDFLQVITKHESYSKNTHFFNFISILEHLKITYDKKYKESLDSIINNPSTWEKIKQYFSDKKTPGYEAFQGLKNSLQFSCDNNDEIDLTGTTFGQTFQNYYSGLKIQSLKYQSWDNIENFKKEQLTQYIIIRTQIEIQPSQNRYQESFNYIKSPSDNIPNYFSKHFPKQFNCIMIESNGWNKLYNELYNLIKNEIGYSKSKIKYNKESISKELVYQNNNNKEDENIQPFDTYLITSIMRKVGNNIQVKYNNYFAQYGVILTDVGERCIYYYSMLIIWRFLCYQRWNSKNQQQKHQNNYQNELNRCIAEINQDNEKQSCIKAKEIFKKLQIELQKQFLDRTKKTVLQRFGEISMSNVELIKKLDQELLIDVDEKKFEDEQFKQKILSYTIDHKQYINNYTLNILTQCQAELLNEYSVKYRQELGVYLNSIQENAKIFYRYIQDQNKEVKTNKYFNEDNNIPKIDYENYLFKLLLQCLHGRIQDKIDIIDQSYKEIFQSSNYNPVQSQFTINLQLFNPQDQQVYNLKTFVETLIQQLESVINNINQIQLNQSDYTLDVEFGKLKFQMNGCEYTCPCCKRKCDQDNDNDHTHKCQNGHQIRGINGIMISNNSPSLFTCEEILDKYLIKSLETNLQKTWKEVKIAHSNWNFQNQNDESNQQNQEKWKNVWNIGLGKLICSNLEKQLKHEIVFSQKSDREYQISNIHYILILDDSHSMKGNKWDDAKNGALHCLKQLENNDQVKVSVIIFNVDARIVVECKKENYRQMSKQINFKGGGTCFEAPFNLALKLIQKYKGFNQISMLFYTDGGAGYPSNMIDQFCQLPQEIRRLINLTACSAQKTSETLALIIKKFSQYMQSAQLKNSVQPADIQRIWTEVVSKNIHQQLA